MPTASRVFQSTPLCEGRRDVSVSFNANVVFQSTPLCEGRPEDAHGALTV